jgi:hypothetical protein
MLNRALAFCLDPRNRGANVKYAAPTKMMVEQILDPLLQAQLQDCPEHVRPYYNPRLCIWHFPLTQARLVIAGCDRGNSKYLRGTPSQRVQVDEAGFIDDLRRILEEVLQPTLLDTGGRMLIGSTPPDTPGHPFTSICERARAEGRLSHKEIYDNPRLSKERIRLFKAEVHKGRLPEDGFPVSTTWLREYEAKHVVDAESSVLPEFTPNINVIVREVPRPRFFNAYAAMDVGFSPDHTFVLWGWWWFQENALVVEHELEMVKMNTAVLAEKAKAIEAEFYIGQGRGQGTEWVDWRTPQPRSRYTDVDHRLIADLSRDHNMTWIATPKDNRDAAINGTRLMCQGSKGQLFIHPRCQKLIAQCQAAVWNNARTDFASSEAYGHYDGVAALVIMCRNVPRGINPVPEGYREVRHDVEYPRPPANTGSLGQFLRDAFGRQ